MSGIDREEVLRVARLARLELSEDEVERLGVEMEDVLSRFRELEAAEESAGAGAGEAGGGDEGQDEGEDAGEGTGAGGDAGPGQAPAGSDGDGESALRPDRPDADPLARSPGEMAPEWEDGYFLVPRLRALGETGGDGKGGEDGRRDGDR